MDIIRAREIVKLLADGVDPVTGEMLAEDSVYNRPEVIRALYTLMNVAFGEEYSVEDREKHLVPRNAGKPWNEIEDDKLRDEFAARVKISSIAKEHGRSFGAIESRLEHLKLKKKSFWR